MFAKLILISILLTGISADKDYDDTVANVFGPLNAPIPLTPTPPVNARWYKPCGNGKECVLNYLCANGKVNSDGATLIDIRFENNPCPFNQLCCAFDEMVSSPIIKHEGPPAGCGFRNKNGIGVKLKGALDEAEFGEFPWMVSILHEESIMDKVILINKCGGSLISPTVVLTGAHCVYKTQDTNFIVRAGEWETNTNTEIYPHQDRQVVHTTVHENFNKRNLYNDIALFILESPFDNAPHINTICLPPAGEKFDMSRCFATGWGKDQFQNGKYVNILKKIDLPVVPNAKCQNDLRNTRLGKYFQLHSSFMCAGGELGKDTCTGDGGSPLVCPMANNPDRFYQAGIVAWGIGCGDENVPGVYASIPKLRSWIDDELSYKGIDAKSFTP